MTDEEKEEAAQKELQQRREEHVEPASSFVDPTNWADEFSSSEGDRRSEALGLPGANLEVGNLSALEDDQSAGATGTDELLLAEDAGNQPELGMPSTRRSIAPLSGPRSPRAALPLVSGELGGRKTSNAKGLIISVVAAVFAVAVAWALHIIPH